MSGLVNLLVQIKKCNTCVDFLPCGVNPVVSASKNSKMIIIGQAPGLIVHNTSIPWNDKSGDNLRSWMDMDKETFYNTELISLMPMGFCYPGKGKSGDLPPRKECAPQWHQKLVDEMPNIKLILLVGQYAQNYYLRDAARKTLTETVRNFKEHQPEFFPLPHPSPRNNIWRKKNEWFDEEVLPELKIHVKQILEL